MKTCHVAHWLLASYFKFLIQYLTHFFSIILVVDVFKRIQFLSFPIESLSSLNWINQLLIYVQDNQFPYNCFSNVFFSFRWYLMLNRGFTMVIKSSSNQYPWKWYSGHKCKIQYDFVKFDTPKSFNILKPIFRYLLNI